MMLVDFNHLAKCQCAVENEELKKALAEKSDVEEAAWLARRQLDDTKFDNEQLKKKFAQSQKDKETLERQLIARQEEVKRLKGQIEGMRMPEQKIVSIMRENEHLKKLIELDMQEKERNHKTYPKPPLGFAALDEARAEVKRLEENINLRKRIEELEIQLKHAHAIKADFMDKCSMLHTKIAELLEEKMREMQRPHDTYKR